MKKEIKKGVKKGAAYLWEYAKMTGLLPEFKKEKKEDKDAKRNR